LQLPFLGLNIISKACERERIGIKGYSPEFIKTLEAYNWPGNVRELVNALEGAISRARYEPTLFPKHLSDQIRIDLARSTITDHMDRDQKGSDRSITSAFTQLLPTIKEFRETIICENEKKYIRELLSVTNGDIREACRIAGLGRARLYGLMKNYGISRAY
jgi:two-component system NtrC family response regulator